MRFNKAADHRPILVALRFFGEDQILDAKDFVLQTCVVLQSRPALPELIKIVDTCAFFVITSNRIPAASLSKQRK